MPILPDVEPSPDRGVEKLAMVGCRHQQRCWRPVIDRLEDDGNQALQFAHVGVVIAPLGDGVELIEE